jgi:hypothetical protein
MSVNTHSPVPPFVHLVLEQVRPFGPVSASVALLALLAWLLLTLVNLFLLLPRSLCVVAFFSMFVPLFIGSIRLLATLCNLSATEMVDQYGSGVVPIRHSAADGSLDEDGEFLLNNEFDTDDVLTFEDTHYEDEEDDIGEERG